MMEYTVDELLEQRKNILQELDDFWSEVDDGGIQLGCCCGCEGDSVKEHLDHLTSQLYVVEAELKLHGVNF